MDVRWTIARRVGILLLLPAVASLAALWLLHVTLVQTGIDARFGQLAGEQRTLCEQLRIHAHMVWMGQDADRSVLWKDTAAFARSLSLLENGGPMGEVALPKAPEDVASQIRALIDAWDGIRPSLEQIAKTPAAAPEAQAAQGYVTRNIGTLARATGDVLGAFEIRREHSRRRLMVAFELMVALDLLLFLAGLWLSERTIARRLREVTAAVRGLHAGDFGTRVPTGGRDELAALACSFNEMAGHIARLLGEVDQERQYSERIGEAARASEARFYDLVQSLDAIVWEADARTGRFLFVSHRAEETLGYPTSAWLGDPGFWLEHVHPDDRDAASLPLHRQAIEGAKGAAAEFRMAAADGRVVWLRNATRVSHDPAGHPRQLHGVMVDITQARRLAEELQHAQKMDALGRLAGGVAHDFNNLLTPILSYAEMLCARLDPVDPRHGYAKQVLRMAERAAALPRQLLAFSRKEVFQPQALDLNVVVADVEKMLRRLIGEDIDLVATREPQLGRIKADPGQLEQVILNLAVNARDAMPQGGRLTIETRNVTLDDAYAAIHAGVSPGAYVVLAVSDTGCGMDAEVAKRIFEPFFTTKEPGKGTGLGLSTVYGIVTQSGGHVRAYSEPGRGSCFKVYLPKAEDGASRADAADGMPDPARGSETILVVEDEAAVRGVARLILESNGYVVLDAGSAEEAFRASRQHSGPIHLLLTDVVMPGMSGRQLAEHLVETRPETRVLYMSGYTDDAIIRHGILDASTAFLQKPFTAHGLTHKVRQSLEARYEQGAAK